MEVTKLSDFLKQQGDTPQGKSTYQAFIDNFDKYYEAEFFRTYETNLITSAFQWDISPEDYTFWDIIAVKWREVTDPENDMLWLLDGKEAPSEQKEYPRWFKSTETEMIVQFDSLQRGKVIGGSVAFADGYYTTIWKPHTDKKEWQEVPNPELTQENDTNVGLDHVEEMQPHQEELSADRHKQIGGDHYAKHTIQPWDIIREYELDYFEGNALKYLLRQKGSRLEDLQKAAHYINECIKNEQKRIENV